MNTEEKLLNRVGFIMNICPGAQRTSDLPKRYQNEMNTIIRVVGYSKVLKYLRGADAV